MTTVYQQSCFPPKAEIIQVLAEIGQGGDRHLSLHFGLFDDHFSAVSHITVLSLQENLCSMFSFFFATGDSENYSVLK